MPDLKLQFAKANFWALAPTEDFLRQAAALSWPTEAFA